MWYEKGENPMMAWQRGLQMAFDNVYNSDFEQRGDAAVKAAMDLLRLAYLLQGYDEKDITITTDMEKDREK